MRTREKIALVKREAKKIVKEREKIEREREIERKKRAKISARKRKAYEKKKSKARTKRLTEERRARKAEWRKELKKNHDREGFFRILLTRNGTRVKTLDYAETLLTAYGIYDKAVLENTEEVIGKRLFEPLRRGNEKVEYELLIVENVRSEENTYTTSFREETGKMVESVVRDSKRHVILAKHSWKIPETYEVYGYGRKTDRKTGKWIHENLITKDLSKDNTRIVSLMKRLIVIQTGTEIDLVVCGCTEIAEGLYVEIAERSANEKHLTFLGKIPATMYETFGRKIAEKTGWKRDYYMVEPHISLFPRG